MGEENRLRPQWYLGPRVTGSGDKGPPIKGALEGLVP